MKHLLLTTIAAVVLVGCGGPSIHVAAGRGNIKAVKEYLAAGADVNAKDWGEWTPLHYAARHGHKEIAELLIDKGADVDAKADNVITPLDAAIKYKHTELADLIRKHGGKTGEELAQLAPRISIHAAAITGNIEAVKKHITARTDVNAKDDYGRTPLHRAAHPNLRIGAFAGKKDVSTQKEIIALLIAEGADVNAKNEDGSTPLYLPAGSGHKEIAELLISKGADVNAKNNWGATPLLLAAIKGHKEIVQLLITKFTDVNAKVALGPKQGSTSLDAADEFNHPEIADILRKHGGKTGEELKADGK